MSGDDLTPKEILIGMVLPQLERIEGAIQREHDYNEQTYVRKDTTDAVDKQSDRLWTKRGVVAAIFGAATAGLLEVFNVIFTHPK